MVNIPKYEKYRGERRVALIDNSSVVFFERLERMGIDARECLCGYDVILIPNWVMVEIEDSIYRREYVEELARGGYPLYSVAEENYSDLVNREEGNLYKIVFASVSKLAAIKSYLRIYVSKENLLDMDEYRYWIGELYHNWPLSCTETNGGRDKKKNAGEISITVLAEIYSWYYPQVESITIYTQDRDSFEFQKNAHKILRDVLGRLDSAGISFKSNDSLLCQMYRMRKLSIEDVKKFRSDEKVVIYTRECNDGSVILTSAQFDNIAFVELLCDESIRVIF